MDNMTYGEVLKQLRRIDMNYFGINIKSSSSFEYLNDSADEGSIEIVSTLL